MIQLLLHPLLLRYVVLPASIVLGVVAAYNYIYYRGVAACESRHIVAEAREEQLLARKYAKIQNSVPLDKPDAIRFLYRHARK